MLVKALALTLDRPLGACPYLRGSVAPGLQIFSGGFRAKASNYSVFIISEVSISSPTAGVD